MAVGEKVTHRLAQHPASCEALRCVRPVVKRRDTGQPVTPRLWKTLFASDPPRSDLNRARDPPTRRR